MGGRCWLVPPNSTNEGGGQRYAPECTDNFQISLFEYKNQEWHSVEQCYQAQKFLDESRMREEIHLAVPNKRKREAGYEYGLRVWRLGNKSAASFIRADWDRVKVDTMFDICMAKYQANPELQKELLGTGNTVIEGQWSTGWLHPTLASQNWSYWNGLIQMRCRELLRPEHEQNCALLSELEAKFDAYRSGYPP